MEGAPEECQSWGAWAGIRGSRYLPCLLWCMETGLSQVSFLLYEGEGVRAAVCVEGGCLSALRPHTPSWTVMKTLSAMPTQYSRTGKPQVSHPHEEVGTAVAYGIISLRSLEPQGLEKGLCGAPPSLGPPPGNMQDMTACFGHTQTGCGWGIRPLLFDLDFPRECTFPVDKSRGQFKTN